MTDQDKQHTPGAMAAQEIDREICRQGDYTIEDMTAIIDKHTAAAIKEKISEYSKLWAEAIKAHDSKHTAELKHLVDMNKGLSTLNDRLKGENRELWESLSLVTHRLESWRGDKNWNSCPDLLDDDVLSDAKTIIVNAGTETAAQRLVVPEPSDEDKQLIEKLDQWAVANTRLKGKIEELVGAIKTIEMRSSEVLNVISDIPGDRGDKLCAIVSHIRNRARAAIAKHPEEGDQ